MRTPPPLHIADSPPADLRGLPRASRAARRTLEREEINPAPRPLLRRASDAPARLVAAVLLVAALRKQERLARKSGGPVLPSMFNNRTGPGSPQSIVARNVSPPLPSTFSLRPAPLPPSPCVPDASAVGLIHMSPAS